MGMFDFLDPSSSQNDNGVFANPNIMALLGAIQGAGATSGYSRLPISNGQVLGSIAGGLMQGGSQGYQNQTGAEQAKDISAQIDQRTLANQLARANYGMLSNAYPDIFPALPGANTRTSQGRPDASPALSYGTNPAGRVVDDSGQGVGPTMAAAQSGASAPFSLAGPGASSKLQFDGRTLLTARFMDAVSPGSGKDYLTAVMKPTEFAQAWNYAASLPADSPAKLPAYQAAYKAAGIDPIVNQRAGGALSVFNPTTGKYDQINYVPKIPENMTLNPGPNGPVATPVPGAREGAASNARIPKEAEYQYDFGVPMPGTPQPGAAPSAPSPSAVSAPTSSPAPQKQPSADNAPTALPTPGRPLQTKQGTVVPPATEQAPIETGAAYLKEALPNWAKTEAEWTKYIPSAQAAEVRLQTIARALKSVESGTWTEEKASFNAKLKALGLKEAFDTDPAKVQEILKNNAGATLDMLKSYTSRFTQMEFGTLSKNLANPNLQPEANLEILAESLGQARYGQAMVRDWAQAKRMGWRNPVDFERAWSERNPMTGFVDQAKAEIGPLKGMNKPGGDGWSIVPVPQ